MKQNNLVQHISICVIIICVLLVGYAFLKPTGQTRNTTQNIGGSVPLVNGKQIIKMTVHAANYDPEFFTVKAGVPVRWEITSSGELGCDSSLMIAKGLVNGDQVYLNPQQGQVTVAEFTPQSPGTYRFSCPMGMVRGKIVVQ